MSPFSMCRLSFLHLLMCANLLFGFMLLRNFSLLGVQDESDVQRAWQLSSENAVNSYQGLQAGQGGSGLVSRLFDLWGARAAASERAELSLCEFMEGGQLPRQVLLQKLVECYKELKSELEDSDMNTNVINNRRLLKEITTQYKESIKASKTINSGHGAPFHLDYSGPQTHPPKNN